MVHDIDVITQRVNAGREIVVDIDITSLDRDGEEDLEPPVMGLHVLREVAVVGRTANDRHQVNWNADTDTLLITKANGNVETAGADIGPFRLRIRGPR